MCSFLIITEYDFIVWMYHSLFIHSLIKGHFDCFQVLAMMFKRKRRHVFSRVRLCSCMDHSSPRFRVGSHFLLQGIFLIQGSNPCHLYLLPWQVDFLPPPLPRKPNDIKLV